MIKYYSMWAVHIIFSLMLLFLNVQLHVSDENNVKHEVLAEIVNTIQENHEESTDYFVVYKLQNGNLIDIETNRKVYGTSNKGDIVKLHLSNYDSGVAERGSTVFWSIVIMILSCVYVWIVTFKLLTDYRKYKKLKYDIGYY